MILQTLYNFLSGLTAELVLALGSLAVKKLCTKKTSRNQHHADGDQPLDHC
ncbi:hypothetical protein ABTX35_16055 [Streptomyces sp. NPDC096080]|uniref:hypothetical protein n=1 Tax=Streptomyces sp. NPDC096080 TaxID=3156693 RepID=UPI00331FDE70